jgi:hypothetical protein
MPVIRATQEAELRKIMVRSQPRQIVLQDPILKNPITKTWAGGVAQAAGPEFRLQNCKNNNNNKLYYFHFFNKLIIMLKCNYLTSSRIRFGFTVAMSFNFYEA